MRRWRIRRQTCTKDPIYGDAGRSCRLHLHAQALGFRHPFTQVRVRLIAQEVPFVTEC